MRQKSVSLQINGKTLTLETGVLAGQATSAVLARLGDTMVLSTVVMGKQDSELDYFPLTVEYVERLYAGGRIKGSRWVKREGRPSDEAILTGRLIDRSIRPLFPRELKKEVQVVVTVLSVDGENDPDVLSLVATACALAISCVPWNGPIGAVRVGLISEKRDGNQEFVVNPDSSEDDLLDFDMVVSSTHDKVLMIEAGGKQVGEDLVMRGVEMAKEWNAKIIKMIEELASAVGEKKVVISRDEKFEEEIMLVEKSYGGDIEKIIEEGIDREVGGELYELVEKIYEVEEVQGQSKKVIAEAVDFVFKKIIRERILKAGKRPDFRAADEIRTISARVGVLPRTHGSAIFERGDTQVLTVATLGTPSLEQLIESPEGEEAKRYIHHYSMPPYSVGETGRIGAASRREIGHGALAERALLSVIPPESRFPYTIRVVSEVMSSNGSTSMASACGSTLSLMDAGVPITEPVAGLALGLVTQKDKYVILSDIIGLEDFSGDMDFKVAGTKDGITAIQLDVKIDGLSSQIIKETLEKARIGRLFILDKMLSVIPGARQKISQFAPKIKVIKVPTEKIGEVIGSGGKTIRNIIATTGAAVDVEDDGTVTISSLKEEAVEGATRWVETLTREIQRGELFEGKVKRILPFGAMVEIVPGKEGLVHVSELSEEYVQNPADVVQIGQTVKVRVKEIDEQGRINLSMRFGSESEGRDRLRAERDRRGSESEERARPPIGSEPQGRRFNRRGSESRSAGRDRPPVGGRGPGIDRRRYGDRKEYRHGPPRDHFPRRRR